MDNKEIAFKVLKELSVLKYAYKSTIEGAIAGVAHQHSLILSPEDKAAIYEIIVEALPRMGFQKKEQEP